MQAALVRYLAAQGYAIRSVADTAARAQGKDIIAATPVGTALWVSVKGYPEKKPHQQARHWFAGAALDLVLYRDEDRTAALALGLPDGFSTYLNLAARVSWLRKQLPFAVFWIGKDGSVRSEVPPVG